MITVMVYSFARVGAVVGMNLLNGGTVEKAQAIAGHESPKTTKLYDRISDEITLDEVERILIWGRLTCRVVVGELK